MIDLQSKLAGFQRREEAPPGHLEAAGAARLRSARLAADPVQAAHTSGCIAALGQADRTFRRWAVAAAASGRQTLARRLQPTMESYGADLTSPPLPLVALVGPPEALPPLADYLRTQHAPRLQSLGVPDAHSAAGAFGEPADAAEDWDRSAAI